MFDSSALDVAIGLSMIFFLFSVIISRLNETLASWTNLRYTGLEKALRGLVGDDPASMLSASKVLSHDLVTTVGGAGKDEVGSTSLLLKVSQGLSVGQRKMSYLPARTFSAAVLDLLDGAAGDARAKDPLVRAGIVVSGMEANADDHNPAIRPLRRMLADADGDRDRFRRSLEHWYDDAMDRVSGWYKRNVQRIILVISIVIVAALNVDTINIAQVLWRVPTERAAVASAAATQAASAQGGNSVDLQVRKVDALNLPIGWTPAHVGTSPSLDPRHTPDTTVSWLRKLLGMLITVIALSLGAPFWFDALSKLSGLGKSGSRPAKSPA